MVAEHSRSFDKHEGSRASGRLAALRPRDRARGGCTQGKTIVSGFVCGGRRQHLILESSITCCTTLGRRSGTSAPRHDARLDLVLLTFGIFAPLADLGGSRSRRRPPPSGA